MLSSDAAPTLTRVAPGCRKLENPRRAASGAARIWARNFSSRYFCTFHSKDMLSRLTSFPSQKTRLATLLDKCQSGAKARKLRSLRR